MGPSWRSSGSSKCYGDYFADLRKKKYLEGCRGSESSTGSRQHFWLPEVLNVCEPGHHGGLQGVKSVMVGPGEGPFTVSKKIGVAEWRGSSTLLAPWSPQCLPTRPPWRPSRCQKCYGGSCWGSFHSFKKNRGRGSSTITILTPWRPP